MRQPSFTHLKRAIHVEDGFTVLNYFYSARGEAFTVADAIHLKKVLASLDPLVVRSMRGENEAIYYNRRF